MAAPVNIRDHNLKLAYDRYMRWLFIASALLLTVIIAAIIAFVGQQGLMAFKEVSPADFFLAGKWDPTDGKFGALSFILGSVYVTVLAVAMGAPLVNTGFGLLAAAAILAVMILPTIISISEDAIRSVPRALEEGSLALGATRWQRSRPGGLSANRPSSSSTRCSPSPAGCCGAD
jgi:phosphate transport system permease protein